MESVDIAILGAGVVGLATASALASPDRSVVLVECNPRHGMETSSRNSEVIHAGIYYMPGSLKARLCVRGREMLYDFCAKYSLPCRRLGKIITAAEENEIPRMEALYKRGLENGVSDLRILTAAEIHALEPGVVALAGIHSPSTGIMSVDRIMDQYRRLAEDAGVMVLTKAGVQAIERRGDGYVITCAGQEPFASRLVINCAGLQADRMAALAGIDIDAAGYRLRYIKGEYFRINSAHRIGMLVYPLPHELGLGIHLTPDISGRLRLGPSAFEVPEVDYAVDPSHAHDFLAAAHHYFPDVTESQLTPDTAGVRPRLRHFTGEHPDFLIREESDRGLPGLINLVGIDSPGFTSAPALAEHVAGMVRELE